MWCNAEQVDQRSPIFPGFAKAGVVVVVRIRALETVFEPSARRIRREVVVPGYAPGPRHGRLDAEDSAQQLAGLVYSARLVGDEYCLAFDLEGLGELGPRHDATMHLREVRQARKCGQADGGVGHRNSPR